jgi:hypothetical protein
VPPRHHPGCWQMGLKHFPDLHQEKPHTLTCFHALMMALLYLSALSFNGLFLSELFLLNGLFLSHGLFIYTLPLFTQNFFPSFFFFETFPIKPSSTSFTSYISSTIAICISFQQISHGAPQSRDWGVAFPGYLLYDHSQVLIRKLFRST